MILGNIWRKYKKKNMQNERKIIIGNDYNIQQCKGNNPDNTFVSSQVLLLTTIQKQETYKRRYSNQGYLFPKD